MAIYLHKLTASGKYDARVVWDGASTFPIPAGHTRELETGANRAQALADIGDAVSTERIALNSTQRDQARDFLMNDARPEMKALRSLALVVMDEINATRGWIESFKVATAAATSLANLQTRVAGLAQMPDRNSVQLLNAMLARISAGDAD